MFRTFISVKICVSLSFKSLLPREVASVLLLEQEVIGEFKESVACDYGRDLYETNNELRRLARESQEEINIDNTLGQAWLPPCISFGLRWGSDSPCRINN